MKTFTLLAVLLFAPVAFADDAAKQGGTTTTTTTGDTSKSTDTGKSAKRAKLTQSELQVLAHYHALNLMEIDLGKTAVKRARSPEVKSYGQMLIEEHGDSDKQMMALAKQHGQKIPAEKPVTDVMKQQKAESKAAAARIKKLRGSEFDTAFLAQMVTDHERELALADNMVAQVQHEELAEMVRANKSVLQRHADRARELQQEMGDTTTSSIGTGPRR